MEIKEDVICGWKSINRICMFPFHRMITNALLLNQLLITFQYRCHQSKWNKHKWVRKILSFVNISSLRRYLFILRFPFSVEQWPMFSRSPYMKILNVIYNPDCPNKNAFFNTGRITASLPKSLWKLESVPDHTPEKRYGIWKDWI